MKYQIFVSDVQKYDIHRFVEENLTHNCAYHVYLLMNGVNMFETDTLQDMLLVIQYILFEYGRFAHIIAEKSEGHYVYITEPTWN